ncbi:MAG: conjugal transfer protein TraD [Cyanobacteria bacterium P01_E01_bin.6]
MAEPSTKIEQQIEQLQEKIKAEQKKVTALRAKARQAERKQRTRRLIEYGGLAEIAGFTTLDKGAFLGLLLENQERIKDEATFRNLKRLGDSMLQERKQARSGKRSSKQSS